MHSRPLMTTTHHMTTGGSASAMIRNDGWMLSRPLMTHTTWQLEAQLAQWYEMTGECSADPWWQTQHDNWRLSYCNVTKWRVNARQTPDDTQYMTTGGSASAMIRNDGWMLSRPLMTNTTWQLEAQLVQRYEMTVECTADPWWHTQHDNWRLS